MKFGVDLEQFYPFEDKSIDLLTRRGDKSKGLNESSLYLTQSKEVIEPVFFPKTQKFSDVFKFKRVKIVSNQRDRVNAVDINPEGEIVFCMNKGIIGKMVKFDTKRTNSKMIKSYSKQLLFKGKPIF